MKGEGQKHRDVRAAVMAAESHIIGVVFHRMALDSGAEMLGVSLESDLDADTEDAIGDTFGTSMTFAEFDNANVETLARGLIEFFSPLYGTASKGRTNNFAKLRQKKLAEVDLAAAVWSGEDPA